MVPQGLAVAPPGPALCAVLAELDPARVANGDTVELLRAWRRLRSFAEAHELAAMAEVGRCDPRARPDAVARSAAPDPGCGQEIATALTLTEQTAWREHALAEMLVHRLPAVLAALAGGRIDRGKATVFADQLEPLGAAQATHICAVMLPEAPGLTTGQLRARLQRMVIAIDPDAARRRYRRALRERRVICYLDHEGTATISAIGLDPSAAQAACERLDALARAVRAAGHPDPLPSIRADLATALLDGSVHSMSHDRIVATMLARAATGTETAGSVGGHLDRDGAGDGAADDHAADHGDGAVGRPDDGPDPGSNEHHGPSDGPGSSGGDPGGPDGSSGDGDGDGGPTGLGDPGSRGDGSGSGGPDGDDGGSEQARAGIEIRVRLSTLLGLDEHPGEIPGLGPLPASAARACVTRQRHAEWRFAIADSDGYLVVAGTTRRRPPARPAHPLIRQAHGGTVELQVDAELLARLAADPPAGWEALIADLAARYARRDQLRTALDRRPHDRFPHPALRRHVEIRDRTCVFPGCRRAARKAQQDHSRDHQHGGPSVADNLGPLCVLHHALKSAGLWRLDQPAPGIFRWRSPLHRVYVTRGEPVCPPLPEPQPDARSREPAPAPTTPTTGRAPPS